MEMKKFFGYRVLISSCLYMFFVVGFSATITPAFGILPDYFGVKITTVMSVFSINLYTAAVLSLFIAAKIIRKFKPKKLMILGGLLWLCYGLIIGLWPSIIGFGIACFLNAFIVSLAMHAMTTSLITSWFVDKRATFIGMNVAFGCFGAAAYQYVLGQMIKSFSLSTVYIAGGLFTCIAIILCSFFIKNEPKEVGQTALGAESAVNTLEVGDNVNLNRHSVIPLLKRPFFWLIVVAAMLGDANVQFIATYATAYLPKFGMSFPTAATIVSILTLSGAAYNFVSGYFMDRIGLKLFIIVTFVAGVFANSMMIMYSTYPVLLVIVLVVIGFTIGYPSTHFSNFIVAPIFGTKLATEANAMIIAFAFISNGTFIPLFMRIATEFGYQTMYTIVICCDLGALTLYLIAYFMVQKQIKNKT